MNQLKKKKMSDLTQNNGIDDQVQKREIDTIQIETQNPTAEKDSQEFPEGGWGWVVVAGTFIIMGTTFGMINAFGEYQKYYLTKFPETKQSILTLIGSLQPFSIYIFSIPSTIFIRHYGPHCAVAISGLIMSFSFMMTSLCKEVWQLALAQGIVFGLGASIGIVVSYTVPQQWFKRRRATAIGIIASGSSIGGIVWPLAVQNLVRQVGFPWASRIIGFIYIPLLAFATVAIKTRDHEISHGQQGNASNASNTEIKQENGIENDRSLDFEQELNSLSSSRSIETENYQRDSISKSNPTSPTNENITQAAAEDDDNKKHWIRRHFFHSQFLIDWTVLKDWRYDTIVMANAIGFFGLFIPLFFIPSYAELLDIRTNVKTYILTIMNSSSVLGRILPGIIGDKVGRLNTLIVAVTLSGVVVFALWMPTKHEPLMIITGLAFGLTSGAFVSLAPAVLGQIFGLNGLQSRLSIFLLMSAPGSLLGPVIGGSFLPTGADSVAQSSTKGYNKLIIFSGVMFFAGAILLIITRLSISRRLFAFV